MGGLIKHLIRFLLIKLINRLAKYLPKNSTFEKYFNLNLYFIYLCLFSLCLKLGSINAQK